MSRKPSRTTPTFHKACQAWHNQHFGSLRTKQIPVIRTPRPKTYIALQSFRSILIDYNPAVFLVFRLFYLQHIPRLNAFHLIYSKGKQFIGSKTRIGLITPNSCSQVNVNGIVYAPNGQVIFNSIVGLTLNGGVYVGTTKIEFNSVDGLVVNAGSSYTNVIPPGMCPNN